MHVAAFLKRPTNHTLGAMVVVYGAERYLKQSARKTVERLVLGEEDDSGPTKFSGSDVDLATVLDELRTVSMWGSRRLVIVEEADEFVSRHRAALENYAAKPATKALLLLDVESWRKNTRLARALENAGLVLECSPLKGAALARWLNETCRTEHGKTLAREAAALLVQLAGTDLGLLDQQLAKLAAYVGQRSEIEPADVRRLVGGWKAETTWTMTNAVRDGRIEVALACLDKLLTAGESPLRILAGITYVFRKVAQAAEMASRPMPLSAALLEAGLFRNEVGSWTTYLRRITRPRAEQIYPWLLQADAGLKGASRLSERTQLERLLVQLSGGLPSDE